MLMITVVIPTHNRSKILGRAIDSVLNQTYQQFEIIIVSDGSTDNTEEVVRKYQNNYDNIFYISVYPNKGANNARNEGIEAAKGDFIAFLDDDDEWLPTKLENQLNVFKSNEKIGLVYTGINVIYVKENVQYTASAGLQGDLSKTILKNNAIGSTSSVMVKKSVLNKSGFFDVNMPAAQDYDLWIRICQLSQVGFASEPGVNYYNNIGEKQISGSVLKHIEAAQMRRNKYAHLFNTLSKDEKKEASKNIYSGIANVALRNNSKKLVLKYSWLALKEKINIKSIIYLLLSPIPYKYILKIRSKIK